MWRRVQVHGWWRPLTNNNRARPSVCAIKTIWKRRGASAIHKRGAVRQKFGCTWAREQRPQVRYCINHKRRRIQPSQCAFFIFLSNGIGETAFRAILSMFIHRSSARIRASINDEKSPVVPETRATASVHQRNSPRPLLLAFSAGVAASKWAPHHSLTIGNDRMLRYTLPIATDLRAIIVSGNQVALAYRKRNTGKLSVTLTQSRSTL
jgi:hypothetical protein